MTQISVIIPTYNRAERLRSCLQALAEQTQPMGDFEVIVVIDGPSPETAETLASLTVLYRLRVIWQEHQGQASALNRGIEASQGEICLFLDDDIVASPHLVAAHLRKHRQGRLVIGIGQITMSLAPDADWYAKCFAQGWREHYQQLGQAGLSPSWEACYSGNMSAPRGLLQRAGGFTTNLARGFDLDLAFRLQQLGGHFEYVPDAVGKQDERKKMRELMADAENAGRADFQMSQRYGHIASQALASFAQGSWRKLLVRRILLALNMPPPVLAFVGRALLHPSRLNSWHSILQNYCYWRGVRRAAGTGCTWQQLTHGVAILMYHAFGSPGERPGRYVMPIARFAAQLRLLKLMRYQVISLREYIDCCRSRHLPPPRSIVLTIDDGYVDTYSLAHPAISRFGFPVTVFLVSGRLGGRNDWDGQGELVGRGLMSGPEAKALSVAGVDLGAHTRSHPALPSRSPTEAWHEIDGSRRDLAVSLGASITHFAYPYGEHNANVQAMVERGGFDGACTTEAGMNTLVTSLKALRRTEVYGTDAWPRFFLALWFGDAEAIVPRDAPRYRGRRLGRLFPVRSRAEQTSP